MIYLYKQFLIRISLVLFEKYGLNRETVGSKAGWFFWERYKGRYMKKETEEFTDFILTLGRLMDKAKI